MKTLKERFESVEDPEKQLSFKFWVEKFRK